VRVTGVAKNTIVKLLAELGRACEAYQMEKLINVPCKRLQCDEIWSFVGAKQKNVPADKQGMWGIGDVDVDRDLRRHEDRAVVARRGSFGDGRAPLHLGSVGAPHVARPGDVRRPQALRGRGGAGVRL
jgi:hypothetical protein